MRLSKVTSARRFFGLKIHRQECFVVPALGTDSFRGCVRPSGTLIRRVDRSHFQQFPKGKTRMKLVPVEGSFALRRLPVPLVL